MQRKHLAIISVLIAFDLNVHCSYVPYVPLWSSMVLYDPLWTGLVLYGFV